MKKLLSLLLSAAIALSLIPAAVPAASAASSKPQAVVTQLAVGKNTVHLYVPESELGGLYTCATAPCFMVFGDKAYTAETAKAEAEASGLAKLAAQEGATVAFINPQGSTWSNADVDVFLDLQDTYSDSSNSTYTNGMTEDGRIMGAVESRVYIYANGSGADFVAANYMKYMSVEQVKGNGDVIPAERTAVGINLFNVTTLPEIREPADIAVAVINGPADTIQKLSKLTEKYKVAASSVKDGFDAQWITTNYDSFSGAYRRQANVTLPIHNYQSEGIVRSIESHTLADGSVINYVVFHSKGLNIGKNAPQVPLVLLFHGGGNTALGVAQTSEWPEIAKANGFIVVSVDRHTSDASPAQVAELLEYLKQKLPIDTSRIYASGFSMGGVKSWGMFDQYPNLLAGIAPLGAVSAPDGNTSTIVPVFYVGGQASPLAEMASQNKEKAVVRFESVFKANQIAKTYNYNAEENAYWGMDGSITYQVTDHAAFKDSTLNVNLYQSTDGKYYTAFGDATNQSHEVYARNCWAAWDFLSQFSRGEDGSIHINSVIYALPSDDGVVRTNSYNVIDAEVTQLTAGEHTVYLYAPISDLGGVYTCATAPCFMVFGDKAYTAETAKAEAETSGLAKLAAQEGATVAFINPQGSTWSNADVDVFLALQGMYSDSGSATAGKALTKDEDGNIVIRGSESSRIYVYANGAGADFVAVNYLKNLDTMGARGVEGHTGASFNLFNVKALPEATEVLDVPIAVINGPTDAAQELAKLTDKSKVSTSSIKDSFDPQWIQNNYVSFSGAYRRHQGVTIPVHHYAAEGIVRSIESFETNSGSVINYVTFYDKELKVTDKNAPVPLILLFHGAGNTALGFAQFSEWPEIAKENGLLAVAVDQHLSINAAQVVELLDHLKEEFSVDDSHVYASGFSMGGNKTWNLFDLYPSLFAAVAPTQLCFAPAEDKVNGVLLPVFYVAGQTSPLPESAATSPDAVKRYEDVFANNQIDDNYSYSADVNKWWGRNGDITYQVTDKEDFRDSTLNVNLYQSTDGNYYTAFADSTNESHEVYARNYWAAWDFLSQFSRSKDGSIRISSVAYTLPSDDGNITSNSYNQIRYDDVAPNAPYAEAVQITTEAGIFMGVGGNKFDPSGAVTRAQAVTALGRLAGAEQKANGSFSDVPDNAWYASYVNWAVESGLVQTDGRGRFLPDEPLTNRQLNLMLRQYTALAGIEASFDDTQDAERTVTRAEFAQQISILLAKN